MRALATPTLPAIMALGFLWPVQVVRPATEPGASTVDRAEVLHLIDAGRYAEAEARARAAVAEAEEALGPDSLEVGETIDLLVESLWRGGKAGLPETRDLAERALRIKKAILGPDHAGTADSLANLGRLLRLSGRLAEARPVLERALAIRELALGPSQPLVSASLNSLANLLVEMGLYGEAKRLYERALAITERSRGPDHAEVAPTLRNLGDVLLQMGELARARSLFERSLAIAETDLGSGHPQVAYILNGLATVADQQGDYETARPLYARALAIAKESLGDGHPFADACLNNLALVERRMGDYNGARTHYEQALEASRRPEWKDHPSTAIAMKNLAGLLQATGDYDEARRLYESSLTIRERTLGSSHPAVATLLHDLATLLEETGDLDAARQLYERAVEIWKHTLVPDHPDFALALNGLASLLARSGDLQGARERHEEALAIQTRSLGSDHPAAAVTRRSLGGVLARTGQSTEALNLLESALAVQSRTFGAAHPEVAATLCDLSGVLAQAGQSARAFETALRSEEASRNHVRLTVAALGERQALAYSASRTTCLDLVLAFTENEPLPASRRRAWDALVRSRALVLDEIAARLQGVRDSAEPRVARLAGALHAATTRLANLLVRGPGPDSPERYRALLDDARRERDRADRALAEKSLSHRERVSRGAAGLPEVIDNLPARSALVSFARYRRPAGDHSYLAFIMIKGRPEIRIVLLGPARDIDNLISRWHEEAARGALAGGRQMLETEAGYRVAAGALRRRVWDPIATHVAHARLVFITPDGALHLLNFAALPVDAHAYLADRAAPFHYLPVERDLVVAARRLHTGSGLLSIGGPAYGEMPVPSSPPAAPATTPCDFRSERFPPLPEAVREAGEITALWKEMASDGAPSDIVHLTGTEATETAFREWSAGKRVVHLATHAFVLGGRCFDAPPSSRGVGGIAPAGTGRADVANPLVLSGLALAGANRRSAAGISDDDGVLTGEEIAAMDLAGVEWAVLSACSTGVGEIRGSEGLFGLRRAFRVAGAATVINSLWPVGDEATRQWMRILYQKRLLDGLSTAGAVWEACREALARRRRTGENTHPFYWAAFVAAGDWR